MATTYEQRLIEIFGFDLANAFSLANSDDTVISIVGSSSTVESTYLRTNGGRDRTVAELRSLIKNQLNGQVQTAQQDDAIGVDLDPSETAGTATVTGYVPEPATAGTADAEVVFDAAAFRKQYTVPESWSDEHVKQYAYAGGQDKPLTRNLNYIIDPTRAGRDLTRGELIDAITGDFEEYTEVNHPDLVAALRKVEHVPDAWTIRAVVEYIKMGLLPAKAEDATITSDVWVEDVSRSLREPESWSDDELRAWLLRLIPAVGVSTEQKLSIEVKRRFNLTADNTAEAVRIAYQRKNAPAEHVALTKPKEVEQPTVQATPVPVVETVIDTATMPLLNGLTALNQTYIVDSLQRFATDGKVGKPNTPATGKALQELLDNVLRYCINLKDNTGFVSAMDYLMAFIKKHQGAGQLFSYDYLYRWTGHLRKGVIQETHKDLLQVIIMLNDDSPLVRQQVDVSTFIKQLPQATQPRLLQYFNSKK